METRFPTKTALTVLTVIVLLCVPQLVPALKNLRSLDPAKIGSVLDFPVRNLPDVEPPTNPLEAPSAQGERQTRRLVEAVNKNLQDPTHELDTFYAALQKGEGAHILHYGDSPTTADLITADARNLFQRDFGDGGIGFVLLARPWAWYNRRGVEMSSSNWQIDIAGLSVLKDGLEGLGGVSFIGGPSAVATWKLKNPSQTSLEVAYLTEPNGGDFTVEADGRPMPVANSTGTSPGTPSTDATPNAAMPPPDAAAMSKEITQTTAGPAGTPGFAHFEIPAGAREFTLHVTRGSVRLYGVDFRKSEPGVVYTSLGVNGANVTLLSRAFNASHWAAELQHYKPDLIIINYGTNESGFANFVDTTWGGELRRVIARLRAAMPDTSILLMSPMDRGEKNTSGEIATLPALPRLVSMEAKIAFEEKVAFFNTYEAMGGSGTMARWYSAEPRLVGADYIHPMPAGARIVSELLFSAFHDGFEQYKMQETKQGVAEVPDGKPAAQ